jgi:hypothetical protein
MIRTVDAHDVVTDKVIYMEYSGTKDDEKPTSLEDGKVISTGSTFLEVDTGDVYLFDEVNSEWHKVGGSDE